VVGVRVFTAMQAAGPLEAGKPETVCLIGVGEDGKAGRSFPGEVAPSSGAQVQKPPRRAACAAYRRWMWIKPGQHGTSARRLSGPPTPPPSASSGLRIQVRTQLRTTSTQFVIGGTGKLATRGRTARKRLSLGRTCTAL
jgi:hypothetical protein